MLLIIAALAWTLIGPPGQAAAAVASGGVTTLTQKRVLDTRKSSALAAHATLTLTLAGEDAKTNVPDSASGVFANLTAVSASAAGFLTVFPAGQPRPVASSLSFDTHQSAYANHLLMRLGQAKRISIYNGSAKSVHVLLDLTGWVDGGWAVDPGATVPTTPARVLDTGTGNGAPSAPVEAGKRIDVQLTGRGGVPTVGIGGVWLQLTVASPQKSGYLVAWPAGRPRPETSTINFVASQTIANQIFVAVGASGKVSLENHSGGTIRLVGDVDGYTRSGPATLQGTVGSVPATRVLDTGAGVGVPAAPVGARRTVTVRIAGRGGVPLLNTRAVVLNVSAVSAQAPGVLSVYPGTYCIAAQVSSLNFAPGRTIANQIVVPLAPDGTVTFYNGSAGSVRIIADVGGVVHGSPPPSFPHVAFNSSLTGEVSISDDGRYVGSGSYIWDTATGVSTLMGGKRTPVHPPYCLAEWETPADDSGGQLSGDGQTFLFFAPPLWDTAPRMGVWNKSSGTSQSITEQPVDDYSITADGAYVAYAPETGIVDFWELATQVLRWSRNTGKNQVIATAPEGRAITTALISGDASTIVYEVDPDPLSPGPVDSYRWRNGQVEHLPTGHVLAISDNGTSMLVTTPNAGGGENLVHRTGGVSLVIASTPGPIEQVALSGDGRVAVWQQQTTSDPDGQRAVYRKTVTGSATGVTHYPNGPGVTSMALSDDGSRLVYTDADGVIVV